MRLAECSVTVVGLGLMGGSLSAALRSRAAVRSVLGVSRRQETIERAEQLGYIDRGTTDLAEGVQHAQIVVLAVPVRTITGMVARLSGLLPQGCVLMDLGSTKTEICRAMEDLPSHVQPIGGHPMCGKESSGLEAAEPGLYEGATFVLTPLVRTPEDTVSLASNLVEAVGGQPLLLEAERHDRLVAAASHLPYLLAITLVSVAESVGMVDNGVWDLVASGFRDTSRLAASDLQMMMDILLTNRESVQEMLERAGTYLVAQSNALRQRDEESLRAWLTSACWRRRSLF